MNRSNMNRRNISDLLASSRGASHANVGTRERIASIAGGALVAAYGLKRFSVGGMALIAAGGALLVRGLSGFCPLNAAIGRDSSEGQQRGIELQTSLTVDRPRSEVYDYWRRLENLPQFMKHLADVRQVSARHSEWVARVPKDMGTIEWDAEIVAEEEDQRLAWRSVNGADVDHAGEVRFEDAPGGRGTEVHVNLAYRPPAGGIGKAASRLLNPAFEQMVKEDLRRFKHVMETGEMPTIEGQPVGA